MRISLAPTVIVLALVSTATAQYFSAGWSPGQKVDEDAPVFVPPPSETLPPAAAVKAPTPEATPFKLSNLLDVNKLLTSQPAVSLFDKLGINITDRVNAAISTQLWDERITLITDDNYKDLIVNEPLTEEEEEKRVWVIVISVTAARPDGVSKLLDDSFDASFNKTLEEQDLPFIKWGRIDYLNVTAITTKWNVWQAPFLVILTDRGQTLRFYRPYQMRLKDDALRQFLKVEGWKQTPVWKSSFGPGGENEYIMDFFAHWLTKIYNVVVLVPKWVMFIASGGIASLLINIMHRPNKQTPAPLKPQPKVVASSSSGSSNTTAKPTSTTAKAAGPSNLTPANTDTEQESRASTPAPTKRASARQRKNKK